jgi:phosphoserine phosphatase RsbU/P
MKVLLVDDDAVARKMHSRLLRLQGHEVVEATDGELAWQLVRETDISLVVSDWMMPNLAGIDLCRRIRAAEFERYIYVILCTSRSLSDDLILGMDAGADDFIVKPISSEEFRVRVRAGERLLLLQEKLSDKNRELAGTNDRLQSAYKLIEDDLKAAAWMQQNLLPPPSLQAHGMRCKWHFEPSSYVAGDIFNMFAMDHNRVCVYLLDVSGHGVPAAMLSVTLSMLLTSDESHGSPLRGYDRDSGIFDPLSPREAICELNRRFQSKDDRYFTMIYGLFDTTTSVLSFAQAGHPSPILIRKTGEFEVLGEGGMPVGVFPEIKVDCFDVRLCKGDRLLLYSDGLTECMNSDNEEFGEVRLLANLERTKSEPLETMLEELLKAIRNWRGVPEFADDLSLLMLELS